MFKFKKKISVEQDIINRLSIYHNKPMSEGNYHVIRHPNGYLVYIVNGCFFQYGLLFEFNLLGKQMSVKSVVDKHEVSRIADTLYNTRF